MIEIMSDIDKLMYRNFVAALAAASDLVASCICVHWDAFWTCRGGSEWIGECLLLVSYVDHLTAMLCHVSCRSSLAS